MQRDMKKINRHVGRYRRGLGLLLRLESGLRLLRATIAANIRITISVVFTRLQRPDSTFVLKQSSFTCCCTEFQFGFGMEQEKS